MSPTRRHRVDEVSSDMEYPEERVRVPFVVSLLCAPPTPFWQRQTAAICIDSGDLSPPFLRVGLFKLIPGTKPDLLCLPQARNPLTVSRQIPEGAPSSRAGRDHMDGCPRNPVAPPLKRYQISDTKGQQKSLKTAPCMTS